MAHASKAHKQVKMLNRKMLRFSELETPLASLIVVVS
jgi:hypothetical protein